VTTINRSGNESAPSNQVEKFINGSVPAPPPPSGSSADTTPPADVIDFSANPGFRKLMLSWTNPSDSDFKGVQIYYRTDRPPASVEDATILGYFIGEPGQTMQITHVGLVNDQSYFYSAASFDGNGNFQNTAQANSTTVHVELDTSAEEPFSTGGCGMIKPGSGGNPPGPGQAAEMIVMLSIILLMLFKKMARTGRVQKVLI